MSLAARWRRARRRFVPSPPRLAAGQAFAVDNNAPQGLLVGRLVADGGGPAPTFAPAGTMPPGLALESDGAIRVAGPLTQPGSFLVAVFVASARGASSAAVLFDVLDPPGGYVVRGYVAPDFVSQ